MTDRASPAAASHERIGRPIDAVLFDLDGTLTRPILDFVRIKEAIGCPQDEPVLEWLAAQPAERREDLEHRLVEFELEAARGAVASEGAAETIDWLRGQGYRVGIITRNCMPAVAVTLERCRLHVECLWTREDRPHKPSGESVAGLCRRMGVDPRRAAVVGDYKYDLQAAREAGSVAVLLVLKEPLPPWAGLADAVIHRLGELKDLLRP